MPDSLLTKAGWKALQGFEGLLTHFSPHGEVAFFENEKEEFPWIQKLESNWYLIREELDQILQYKDTLPNFQEISEDQTDITTDDRWKTYFLYGFGHKAEANCERCPETTRLVEQVPGMKTAFFSILDPGKKIPPHRGPYKGVMRYHLGLKVPDPKEECWIRVADEVRHWEEGQSLLFDDTHEHEVQNNTDGMRCILFMDVVRPFTPPVDTLNNLLIKAISVSPFVKRAKKNQKQWEKRFREVKEKSEAVSQ
jgi:beta-hydroxylase